VSTKQRFGKALLLTCAVLIVSLAGAAPVLGQVKTLQWFAPMSAGPELDLWTGLIEEFEAEHPNIKVKLSVEPWNDYWQKLAVMFGGGQHPDLCWMHYTYFKDYAEQNVLKPLDEFMARDPDLGREDFVDVLLSIFEHRGKQYVLPKDNGGIATWYNMDMFDEAGVHYPEFGWTWDDFLAYSMKLTQDINGDGITDQWGCTDIMFAGNPANWWHHEQGWAMIKSFGGNTYSDDFTECYVDQPETVEAIQFMADAINKYGIAPRGEQVAGLGPVFRIGKTAMACFPHAAEGYFIRYEDRPVERYGVEFVPQGKGGIYYGVGATGFAIPTRSRYPDEAWEFIKFALRKSTGEKVAEHYRWGAARKDVFGYRFRLQESRGIQIEQNWQRVWVDSALKPEELGINLGHGLVPAGVQEINTILQTEFDPVYLGTRTAEEAARRAKDKILKVLHRTYK
jgi:multiple sugar transport system substrate-binding protein